MQGFIITTCTNCQNAVSPRPAALEKSMYVHGRMSVDTVNHVSVLFQKQFDLTDIPRGSWGPPGSLAPVWACCPGVTLGSVVLHLEWGLGPGEGSHSGPCTHTDLEMCFLKLFVSSQRDKTTILNILGNCMLHVYLNILPYHRWSW